MSADYHAGRIRLGREHLENNMPSFEILAQTDEAVPKMLPDIDFWQSLKAD